MPFVRIWVHLIWSTKDRAKIISPELKPKLIEHIRTNCKAKGIGLDSINCVSDHIHILISLKSEMSVGKEVMLIKGESSHWINQNEYTQPLFQWQDEYIALSVSDSMVEKVREYINSQEEHHKTKTYSDEYDEFIK